MSGVRRRRSSRWVYWGVRVWLAVMSAFFLWQAVTYRGLVALAAEWQFNKFGIYYPAVTYLLLVLLFSSPLLLLWRRRTPAQRHHATLPASLRRSIAASRRFMYLALASAAAVVVAAIFTAGLILLLPRASGPVQRLTASISDPAHPAEGATELSGRTLYSRTAAFNEDLWFARYSTRFAPVVEEAADGMTIRYFVELGPTEKGVSAVEVGARRGILKKTGLPGELIRLYRYAGFRVVPDYYVLFATKEALRRPYIVTALELLVMALFLSLIGVGQWIRRERLIRQLRRPEDS